MGYAIREEIKIFAMYLLKIGDEFTGDLILSKDGKLKENDKILDDPILMPMAKGQFSCDDDENISTTFMETEIEEQRIGKKKCTYTYIINMHICTEYRT